MLNAIELTGLGLKNPCRKLAGRTPLSNMMLSFCQQAGLLNSVQLLAT